LIIKDNWEKKEKKQEKKKKTSLEGIKKEKSFWQ